MCYGRRWLSDLLVTGVLRLATAKSVNHRVRCVPNRCQWEVRQSRSGQHWKQPPPCSMRPSPEPWKWEVGQCCIGKHRNHPPPYSMRLVPPCSMRPSPEPWKWEVGQCCIGKHRNHPPPYSMRLVESPGMVREPAVEPARFPCGSVWALHVHSVILSRAALPHNVVQWFDPPPPRPSFFLSRYHKKDPKPHVDVTPAHQQHLAIEGCPLVVARWQSMACWPPNTDPNVKGCDS